MGRNRSLALIFLLTIASFAAIKTDSLTFNKISYLKTYIDTSFPCSLYANSTYKKATNFKCIKIGNIVNFYTVDLADTMQIGDTMVLKGMPSKFLPSLPLVVNASYWYAASVGGGWLNLSSKGLWFYNSAKRYMGTAPCLIIWYKE